MRVERRAQLCSGVQSTGRRKPAGSSHLRWPRAAQVLLTGTGSAGPGQQGAPGPRGPLWESHCLLPGCGKGRGREGEDSGRARGPGASRECVPPLSRLAWGWGSTGWPLRGDSELGRALLANPLPELRPGHSSGGSSLLLLECPPPPAHLPDTRPEPPAGPSPQDPPAPAAAPRAYTGAQRSPAQRVSGAQLLLECVRWQLRDEARRAWGWGLRRTRCRQRSPSSWRG